MGPWVCALAGLLIVPLAALGQAFPQKPVRVIVPLPPGGSIDFTVRTLSDRFQVITGQPLVIESRAGASGIIAAELAAKSAPDGYTLLAGTVGQFSINPFTFRKLPYDPARDFAPVTQMVRTNYFWIVSPAAPVSSLKEFVAWARANPEKATYASGGVGSISHFASVMIAVAAGIDMTHVPYKGSAQHMTDLLAGRVSAAFSPLVSFKDHLKSGQIRVLAAATEQRSGALPDLPTFVELGYTDVVAPLWSGLMAPAGTPAPLVEALSRALTQSLASPDVRTRMLNIDQEPVGGPPAEFTRFLEADRERWGKAIRASGFKPAD